jgi:hypothetical protein
LSRASSAEAEESTTIGSNVTNLGVGCRRLECCNDKLHDTTCSVGGMRFGRYQSSQEQAAELEHTLSEASLEGYPKTTPGVQHTQERGGAS